MTKSLCNLATIGESIGRLCFQHKTSLDQIAADFQHPAWSAIDEAVNTNTFSFGVDFLQHQQLVASAVFRLTDTRKLVSGLISHDVVVELVPLPVWISAVKSCQSMIAELLGAEEGSAMAKAYVTEKIECILQVVPSLNTT